MNPRVLAWLSAVGLKPDAIARRCGEDVPRVTVDGESNVWTVHYIIWIGRKWHEWAATKGFTKGADAHRDAQRAGHCDFDFWLTGEV